MNAKQTSRLITDANVTAHFQELVDAAVIKQGVDTTPEAVYYLVNLLTAFTDARLLFEKSKEGRTLRPLALLYADALAAESLETRHKTLRRLGDVALFIAGVFSDSLNRKAVDIDYYIAMGGNAYGYLSQTAKSASRWQMFADVFDELANKFIQFVDVLNEVGEHTQNKSNTDILRLYEVWIRTGSKRAEKCLQEQGIQPLLGAVSKTRH